MNVELILFDLDDTLMAFDRVAKEAWGKAVDIFLQNRNIHAEKNDLLERIHATRKWYWSDPERHKIGRKNLAVTRRKLVKLALKDYASIANNELEELADALIDSVNEA